MTEKYVVCFGEILWDNLISGRRLGGAPLNVCYHLNKLGVDSKIIAQVGGDQDGRDIIQELKRLDIHSAYCSVSPNKPTSTVEVLVDTSQDISYDIREDVAWDYIESSPDIEQLVEGSAALVFGSLIARHTVSRNTLYQLVRRSTFRVFDVNLRHPHYTQDLIINLLSITNLLKLNEAELKIISEWLDGGHLSMDRQVSMLQERFPDIQEIILTLGADGARYYSGKTLFIVQGQPVEIKDTVGSGDAFLAGFLAYKLKGNTIPESLQAGIHLSSFVAGQQGACPEYIPDALKL